jgi:hypothetical protein
LIVKPEEITFYAKGDGMYWVSVAFTNRATWAPGFEDICRMIVGIGACEDARYPESWQKGRKFMGPLFEAVLQKPFRQEATSLNGAQWDAYWAPIAKRFNLKYRESGVAVPVQAKLDIGIPS